MIFLEAARLAILSQPKTGSVALEQALFPRSDMIFKRPDRMKHINYKSFEQHVAPMLTAVAGMARTDYEVVAVMREPLSWLGSMFRYNSRDKWRNPEQRKLRYTGDVTFEEFVLNVCRPHHDRPEYARIGSPCSVAFDVNGKIGVDRLFPYEDLSGLHRLVEERTGAAIEKKQLNVSPARPMEIMAETRELFAHTYSFENELHASLQADGRVDPRYRST